MTNGFLDDSRFGSKLVTEEKALDLLEQSQLWFNLKKLEINGGKTQVLTCKLSREAMPSDVVFVKLHSGSILTPHSNWGLHLASVCTRISWTLYLQRKLKAQRPDSYMLPSPTLTLDMGFFFRDTHQPAIVSFSCRRKLRCTWLSMVDLETCWPVFIKLQILTIFNQYVLESLIYVKTNLNFFCTKKLTWTSFAPEVKCMVAHSTEEHWTRLDANWEKPRYAFKSKPEKF